MYEVSWHKPLRYNQQMTCKYSITVTIIVPSSRSATAGHQELLTCTVLQHKYDTVQGIRARKQSTKLITDFQFHIHPHIDIAGMHRT